MQKLFRLLFVGLLSVWMSLKVAQCQNLDRGVYTTSFCNNTSSGKTCFTTFITNNRSALRKPFKTASQWCKATAPGSSLIIINSIESQKTVGSFIGRQVLANEIIFTDAQKLSPSKSLEWAWVNGYPTVPRDVRAEQIHDGACVELKPGQSLTYCVGIVSSLLRYICESAEWKSDSNYRQHIKSYVVREGPATWYDARKDCLRSGGDLASITDLRTIEDWPRLKEGQRYWIGLHRNKWIWNSTGSPITYTNWESGYPDESSDKQCICINPKCRKVKERTICEAEYDRKWRTCNCNHNYAIVCRKGENVDAVTTKTVVSEEMLSWKSSDFKSYASSPLLTTSEDKTTAFASSSSTTSLFKSFTLTELLLILLLFVTVVLIVFVVIVVIGKCKSARRKEESPLKKTYQNEAFSSEYDTMVLDKRPSEGTVPIYTELEMSQQPTPSNNTIYSKMQPTSEAVDIDISVYANAHEV